MPGSTDWGVSLKSKEINDPNFGMVDLPNPNIHCVITNEMVERAAMALWDKGVHKGDYPKYPYDRLIEESVNDLRECARAALEAALNP
jgi:hypothetical protein